MTALVRLGLCAVLGLVSGCAGEETLAPTPGSPADSGGDSAVTTGGAPDTATGGVPDTGTGGTPDTGTGGTPDTGTGGTPVVRPDGEIDPVGVWWTELDTLGAEELPWVGNLMGTNIRFVMRVEVSGTAPNHEVKFDFCELQTEWTDPVTPDNITTIGFRPPTVASFSEVTTANLGGLGVGSEIPLPDMMFRGGKDESGMEFDDDGDGNPAVTAWVKTLLGIEIEVYETIDISAKLALTAADKDTMSGTLDFRADAMIISSNNVIIVSGTPVTIIPDSTEVPITVKRLPNGGDCGDLPSTVKFTTVPPAPPPLVVEPAPEPPPAATP